MLVLTPKISAASRTVMYLHSVMAASFHYPTVCAGIGINRKTLSKARERIRRKIIISITMRIKGAECRLLHSSQEVNYVCCRQRSK